MGLGIPLEEAWVCLLEIVGQCIDQKRIGAATEKARSPYLSKLVRGTDRRFCLQESKQRRAGGADWGYLVLSGTQGLFRGVSCQVSSTSLYWILRLTDRQ